MTNQKLEMSAEEAASFVPRHIGPSPADVRAMLDLLGYDILDALIDATVPAGIRLKRPLAIHAPMSEYEALVESARDRAQESDRALVPRARLLRHVTPPVIQRNILENPGWYTAYTPYQAEIAQGRLEALLNFQTMVMDLTGLEIANASLLDEGTAAAEAMAMSYARARQAGQGDVLRLRRVPSADDRRREDARACARRRGRRRRLARSARSATTSSACCCSIRRPTAPCTTTASSASARTRSSALVTVATDLMSLVLLTPPGEWGADVAVGNSQRFGVPLGYGGPHAAFFATKDEFKRQLPGRIIGVSRDADGKPALRMALQTREQHIRREKATSNVCTAQVLLAVIAGMYAVYHGPERLTAIATRIHDARCDARGGPRAAGLLARRATISSTRSASSWATGRRATSSARRARSGINLRALGDVARRSSRSTRR